MFDDANRAQLWVDCSQRWFDNSDSLVQLNVQMLGHAEPPILALEQRLAQSSPYSRATIEQGALLMQCSALSVYWLFGLYETLRTLRQCAPRRFRVLEPLFHEVTVARMPLAKHQVKSARGYPRTEHYPTSVWDIQTGRVGWHVFDPNVEHMITVSRTDIADRFLKIDCEK